MGFPKFSNLGLPQLWKLITLYENLLLRWGLKKNCSPCQDLSNGMWHAIFTQRNQGDSWLLTVEIQIDNLTFSLSFGHNLCFKYPNGSYEPILDIYVPRAFQWYKKLFNPMSFDPCNHLLKIPKWELTWECGGSFPHTLLHSRAHSWLAPLQALALVMNPRLGLW
jgi:hypothetical protein